MQDADAIDEWSTSRIFADSPPGAPPVHEETVELTRVAQ
jgi:hypothetical protein